MGRSLLPQDLREVRGGKAHALLQRVDTSELGKIGSSPGYGDSPVSSVSCDEDRGHGQFSYRTTEAGNMATLEFRGDNAPADSELLTGLKRQEINLIVAAATLRHFSPKSVMTDQAEPADYLFLLWKGRARYFFETPNGKKVILAWITPGHIFGATALVSQPCTYLVSTEAKQDSIVLVWDSPTIRALARRFPPLMENALLTCKDYLSWYVATHAALTSQAARERLAHVLLGYAPSIGQKVSGGIELDVTNEELANATNLTRYTVSRIITKWQRTGAIRKNHKKILLLSPKTFFRNVVRPGR